MARRGKKIDHVHWTAFSNGASSLSAGSSAVQLIAAQHLPETLLRTRGWLLCYPTATQPPGGQCLITIGFIVVPEGTGTTVLSRPFTESDADWFYHTSFPIGYQEMVTDVIDVPVASGHREVIDSKAMRKVHGASEIQMVMENTTTETAINVKVRVGGRFLTGS